MSSKLFQSISLEIQNIHATIKCDIEANGIESHRKNWSVRTAGVIYLENSSQMLKEFIKLKYDFSKTCWYTVKPVILAAHDQKYRLLILVDSWSTLFDDLIITLILGSI